MSFDILLVVGCVLGALSIVSVMSALVDGRRPRVAAFVVVVSGALILGAAYVAPDGLQPSDVPNSFVNIAAQMLN